MTHRILILELDIRLYDTHSLKQKRALRRRLTERLKAEFNISVAETAYLDLWQRIGLTIAYVALDQSTASSMADKLRRAVESLLATDGELVAVESDIV